jgi:hypothetical protein
MAEMTRIAKALRSFPDQARVQLENYLDKVASRFEDIYVYRTGDGTPQFGVIRLRDGNEKTFRVFHIAAEQVVFKKPPMPAEGFALLGGDLPLRYPNASIIVCEGEKATIALLHFIHQAGALDQYVAVTSGGSKTACSAHWDDLVGRNVLIWADKDQPGVSYATDVQDQLRGIARSCKFIDIVRLSLPVSGDAVEWVAAQAQVSTDAIANLPVIDTVPVINFTEAVEAPLPLFREVSGRKEFPVGELGPTLGAAAMAMAKAVQCPEVITGNAVLVAAALVVQGHANVYVDGREIPVSIFALTIAGSGERKTSADKLAMAPVNAYQSKRYAEYKVAMKAHKAAMKALEKGEIPPDEPIDPTFLIQDPTIDAMIRGLINGWPSQALVLSEGGSFLGGYAMAKENMVRTGAVTSAVWSGENISQARVTGRHMASNRRLSIHLQGQPDIVASFVGNELLQNQGLLQRFLMAEPESRIGSRLYARTNIKQDAGYRTYVEKLERLLEATLPINDNGELQPRELVLSDAAYITWVDAHDAIERASATGGALEHYQAYAAKLAEQILRIAGVITLFENLDAAEISDETMRSAIHLADFYLHEATRLLIGPGDKQLNRAKELLQWLKRRQSPIALRDIYRNGPKFVRSADEARRLIEILMSHGWVGPFDGDVIAQDGKLSRENYSVLAHV